MQKRTRPMTQCTTCGTPIPLPVLPTPRPRCFPCIKAEIRAALEQSKD
jgi:hypothetical protein